MRVGAIPELRLRNLYRIESDDLITLVEFVKPQFTRGFKDEYVTFTTPECSKGIDEYLNMRI